MLMMGEDMATLYFLLNFAVRVKPLQKMKFKKHKLIVCVTLKLIFYPTLLSSSLI